MLLGRGNLAECGHAAGPEGRAGPRGLTAWHRWVGIAIAWTIACHATFVLLGFARLDGASVPETFGSLARVTASVLGM